MKLIFIFASLYLAVVSIYAQGNFPQAKLVVTLSDDSQDPFEIIDNLALKIKSEFSPDGSMVAIRVCSTELLPVAISISNGIPFIAASRFQTYGVPQSAIVYLRTDKNCKRQRSGRPRLEYWFVPNGAELPEFTELQYASNIRFLVLAEGDKFMSDRTTADEKSAWDAITPGAYVSVIEKLVQKLKANRSATAVVEVVKDRKTETSLLERRVNRIKGVLNSNRIRSSRLLIKNIYSSSNLNYPSITIIIPE